VEDQPDSPSRKRGEAAYKENLARISERNAKAKKAGREQREEYERQQDERRRLRELREQAGLTKDG
jgi:hypothetical protein